MDQNSSIEKKNHKKLFKAFILMNPMRGKAFYR